MAAVYLFWSGFSPAAVNAIKQLFSRSDQFDHVIKLLALNSENASNAGYNAVF
jgi:hypothetical protein